MQSFRLFAASIVLAAFAMPIRAATLTWPGAAPCNTTLQACINAAVDGDRIEVATNTPINENLSISSRSLDLVASIGYRPTLSDLRSISLTSNSLAGNLTTNVSGFRLRGSYVFASYLGTGTANYTISDMTLEPTASGSGSHVEVGIARGVIGVGSMNLTLDNNRVDCGSILSRTAAVQIAAEAGATLNARLLHNKIRCSALGGQVNYGIVARIGSPTSGVATADLRLHGNEVRVVPFSGTPIGVASFTGIAVIEDSGSLSPSAISSRFFSNVVIGDGQAQSANAMQFVVDNGDLNAIVLNNTLTGFYRSLYATSFNAPGSGPQIIDGPVRNNVMVSYGPAFYLQETTTSGLTNSHNLVNAPELGSGVTLGAGSITAPARLVSASNPRLRPDSPAIDAADTASLGFGILLGNLPVLDADGLRRIKGATDSADIGAYEYGDIHFGHVATAANTGGHITTLDAPALNGLPTARAFANIRYPDPGGNGHALPWGVYYSAPRWRVFDQASTAVPANTQFSVFVPAPGSGLFTHSAAASSNFFTQIDSTSTNDLPNRIVLAEQNWSLGSIYNPHPISVYYGTSRWYIDNSDFATMPAGAGFNVYVQPPSPNAFIIVSSAANTINQTAMLVDHPLLTGIGCARPVATRVTPGAGTASQWRWMWSGGVWWLTSETAGVGTLTSGSKFHVVVNPAQVADCLDRIFTNGFDS